MDDVVIAQLKVAQLQEEVASTKVLMQKQQELFSHKIDIVRNELQEGQQVMKETQKANEVKVNEIIDTLKD
jgi:predicted transcriptional regulator